MKHRLRRAKKYQKRERQILINLTALRKIQHKNQKKKINSQRARTSGRALFTQQLTDTPETSEKQLHPHQLKPNQRQGTNNLR